MIIDQTIDRLVGNNLLEEYLKRKEEHISSGMLSASRLGKPTQWQVLHSIGVPSKELDEYVVRKFQRGEHVETWLVDKLVDVVETQKEVNYKGVVGLADAVIDTKKYEANLGHLCVEVKSVTNANFRWINKKMEISLGHALQGALYGLSQGHKYFAVCYVASDDYRVLMMIEETQKYKDQIDKIINEYNKCMEKKVVPVFEAVEEWQKKPDYQDYPEWTNLTQEQINKKLKDYKTIWTLEK